jgi:hypothetical protein
MDETLKKIREAYYRAGREQPPEYNPLPPWEAQPLQVRELLIAMYHAGREDAQRDPEISSSA